MADPFRAIRAFERMCPGTGYETHLKCTNPEGYREYIKSLGEDSGFPPEAIRFIIVYNPNTKKREKRSPDGKLIETLK